jgi:hypothetical protein
MPRSSTAIRWIASRTDRADAALEVAPLGPWTLARPIGHCAVGARFMAFHTDSAEPALAYRVDRRLCAARTDTSAALDPGHQHILAPREAHRDAAGDLWLIAPFVGSARGLLTLEQLASARDGGAIARPEAAFVGLQLLAASAHAHALGHIHGPIDAGQVLVHPRGSLLVELYGVERRLRDLPVACDADRAAETRSIIAMVSRLTFGSATAPHAGPLGAWINQGLGTGAFPSASAALDALDAALPAMGAPKSARGSWARDIVGMLSWTLNRR